MSNVEIEAMLASQVVELPVASPGVRRVAVSLLYHEPLLLARLQESTFHVWSTANKRRIGVAALVEPSAWTEDFVASAEAPIKE